MFTTNEGTLDRGARVIAGLSLLALAFTTLTGIWQIIAPLVGLILLATGAVGFCPLYALFGINTRPRRPAARH